MRTFFQKGRTWMAALACAFVLTSCMEDEVVNPIDDASLDARNMTTATTSASTIIGLSKTNELYHITATNPATVSAIKPIVGLKEGDSIVAIDFRPSTSQLYGISANGLLYIIDRNTGAATLVSQTPIDLAGSQFGMDFNPRTDMLRIVTDKGQNIAVSPSTGAVVSSYWSTNTTAKINSIAYLSTSATTAGPLMYDISSADYKLYAQNEKTGVLTSIGTTGLILNGDGGLDISKSGTAYAIYTARADSTTNPTFSTSPYGDDPTQEASRLYTINLRTGMATSYGKVGNNLIGVAVM
jgi:hypothetical protein